MGAAAIVARTRKGAAVEAKEEAANNVIIPDLKALKLYIYRC